MENKITEWTSYVLPWVLSHGVRILIILIAALIIGRITKKLIEKIVTSNIIPDKSLSKNDKKKRGETLVRIFSGAAKIIILSIAILMILEEMGLMIGPILAGAGIVGLAVGFGGQYLIRDVISGMFIILENQYRIGDIVKFDNIGGLVEDISLRMTTIRDLDGTVHHIPHGEIKKVSNLSKYFSRVNLNIGVSYNSNLEHVIKVINETGKTLASDPNWKEFIITPPQFLRVDDFADSAIMIKVLGDTKPTKQWDIAGEFRKRIKIAFDKEGIEIPFPQVVVHKGK